MRVSARPVAALVVACTLVLGGCGGDGEDTASGSGSGDGGGASPTESPSHTRSESPSESPTASPTPADDDVLSIEIEIDDGRTAPSGARIDATVGQTIRLEVDSDMTDELHLHANPEQSFDVKAADDQVFEFSLDTPGVYELESHETGDQIVSIQVQP